MTIPWMQRSQVSGPVAATIVAGNAGLGAVFPRGSSFFILTGSATVMPLLDADNLVLPLFVAGAWCLLYGSSSSPFSSANTTSVRWTPPTSVRCDATWRPDGRPC